MKEVLLFIWQFPQMLLGIALRLFYKGKDSTYKDAIVRRSMSMLGGISLGKYIIISQWFSEREVKHKYGHCRQSKMLGWFYLIVIGLPSIIWAWLYRGEKEGYYKFYTETWADRLGEVER